MRNQTYLAELEASIDKWGNNTDALKIKADRVEPPNKAAYQEELDFLVVKLSFLTEYRRQLLRRDEMNARTRTTIQRTLREMERTFASAVAKMS